MNHATIDETIERVEQLYVTLTGKRPPTPNGHRAAIPPETDPVVHVQEELGRMVSAVERLLPTSIRSTPAWIPRAIVSHRESELVISLDVPGVSREDLQIRVEPRALVVTGQRRGQSAQPPSTVASCDVPLGAFARSFPLAGAVAPDHISARLEVGVLTIRIRGTQPESSQISITS